MLAVGLVLGLDFHLLALGHDAVDDVLRRVIPLAELLERRILAAELLAVVVDVAYGLLDEDAPGRDLAVAAGELRGVERHEEVGHHASAAIDRAVLAQRPVFQAVGEVDAVGRIELAVQEPLVEVVVVVFLVALLVGLLDAASRGRVVVGDGDSHHRPVGEVERALHESLAKGATAHHRGAVLVLERTRDDLGGGGAELVDEHHHLAVQELAVALGAVFLARHGAPLHVDDEVARLQELVGYAHGGIEEAAAVVLQVEHQVAHALALERVDGRHELIVGRCAEAADAHVADGGADHVGGVDGLEGNFVAHDGERQHARDAAAHHAEPHLGAPLAAQAAHNLVAAHLHAGYGGVVDADDAVAGQHAHLFRGAVGDGLDDQQRVAVHVELHADAVEGALERLHHLLGLLGGRIGGVGIEAAEHSPDGVLREVVGADGVHIYVLYGIFGHLQLAHRLHVGAADLDLRPRAEGHQQRGSCHNHFSWFHCLSFFVGARVVGGGGKLWGSYGLDGPARGPPHQSMGSVSWGRSSSITRLSMMKFWRSMVFLPI